MDHDLHEFHDATQDEIVVVHILADPLLEHEQKQIEEEAVRRVIK